MTSFAEDSTAGETLSIICKQHIEARDIGVRNCLPLKNVFVCVCERDRED